MWKLNLRQLPTQIFFLDKQCQISLKLYNLLLNLMESPGAMGERALIDVNENQLVQAFRRQSITQLCVVQL
jgi:hypothetical protein